ncbi:hypothetical protein C7974DRAFT_390229 [Boeremia exigua]|uniref:uncharacterized protein n=1 Tax=Boeremia exigua TaxID=749465 RepID=UPI001E8E4D5B|nr:uncharacterized protein C7974DRAFT_390229 [Boeremia exigua]KAH6637770.1 hypothetical protein C7974DRAFT_390229 [Boeremia exigua]
MKPRPVFAALGAPRARAQLQCRQVSFLRAAGTPYALSRCASTSTASASKIRYPMPPPAPAKPSAAKPHTPGPTTKPAAPAKHHSAPSAAKHSSSPAKHAPAPAALSPTPASTNDPLNPPPFTYPPDLSVPARKPGQAYIPYLFACGKAYIAFYKTGISHTRQTLKYAKSVRAKTGGQGRGVQSDAPGAGLLTRAEWQVARRSKRDLIRLPVMGFLILALGEWLPLIVVYLTPVVPEACRIPAQVARVLRLKEEGRRERLSRIATHALRLQSRDRTPRTDESAIRLGAAAEGLLSPEAKVGKAGGVPMASAIVPPGAAGDLGLFHLLLLSARLDCHPRILDRLYLTPPKWLLQRNVSKTLAYLTQDDELIRRDGGAQALSKQELLRACVDRGIDVLEKSEAEQRRSLWQWYKM